MTGNQNRIKTLAQVAEIVKAKHGVAYTPQNLSNVEKRAMAKIRTALMARMEAKVMR